MIYEDVIYCWQCGEETMQEVRVADDDPNYLLKCKQCMGSRCISREPDDFVEDPKPHNFLN